MTKSKFPVFFYTSLIANIAQYGVSFIIVAASISYEAAMQSTFQGKMFAQPGRLGHKGRHTLIFLSGIEVPMNLRLITFIFLSKKTMKSLNFVGVSTKTLAVNILPLLELYTHGHSKTCYQTTTPW